MIKPEEVNDIKKPIAPVSDYPLLDLTTQEGDHYSNDLLAYYHAGYLIILRDDDSTLKQRLGLPEESSLDIKFLSPTAFSVPNESSTPPDLTLENPDDKQPEGAATPTAPPPHIIRNLYAKRTDGSLACHQIMASDSSTLSAKIRDWQLTLKPASDADSLQSSNVNPDPNAWTLIGGKTFSIEAKGYFSPWWFNNNWEWYDTGSVDATVSLYRLNSIDAFDYFLVKTNWKVTPKFIRNEYAYGRWFYNKDHTLSVQLSALTANGEVEGELLSFAPETVAESQTYKVSLGGELSTKISEKPEIGGKVSAGIETEYTIDSVKTTCNASGPLVSWRLEHFNESELAVTTWFVKNLPDTTIYGVSPVTWSLYRFNRSINEHKAPEMKIDMHLNGNFRSEARKWWLLTQFTDLPYELKQTISYPVPTMSYEPAHSPQNPIEIAPGKTVEIQIKASAPGLPLNWKCCEIPKNQQGGEFLAVSPANAFLGDGVLKITALENAGPGTFGYIRINSIPNTATDSLRRGGIDLPVKIIAD